MPHDFAFCAYAYSPSRSRIPCQAWMHILPCISGSPRRYLPLVRWLPNISFSQRADTAQRFYPWVPCSRTAKLVAGQSSTLRICPVVSSITYLSVSCNAPPYPGLFEHADVYLHTLTSYNNHDYQQYQYLTHVIPPAPVRDNSSITMNSWKISISSPVISSFSLMRDAERP